MDLHDSQRMRSGKFLGGPLDGLEAPIPDDEGHVFAAAHSEVEGAVGLYRVEGNLAIYDGPNPPKTPGREPPTRDADRSRN